MNESEKEFVTVCMILCLKHRAEFGLEDEPRQQSCKLSQCKAGCPLGKDSGIFSHIW
jgi:hypothetical protein